MKEKSDEEINETKQYIKILNKEKVLEFKSNHKSGFEEAEIIIQNITQEDIISKIYINNYKNFKVIPNIIISPKNSTSKIKVMMDNKDYTISNSDVFLIISHPIENTKTIDKKNLNEYFKNNEFKEKGEKVFLVGYKKGEEKKDKNKCKDGDLIKRIKELEKEVFDDAGKDINVIKNESGSSYITYLILFSLLVFAISLIISKFFKK